MKSPTNIHCGKCVEAVVDLRVTWLSSMRVMCEGGVDTYNMYMYMWCMERAHGLVCTGHWEAYLLFDVRVRMTSRGTAERPLVSVGPTSNTAVVFGAWCSQYAVGRASTAR